MLRELTTYDIDKVLHWRNAAEVRKNMFTDHVITADEHLSWWQKLNNDPSRKSLIFVRNGVDEGVVNFFDIDNIDHSCHWGFYLSSQLKDIQTNIQAWQLLEQEAIDYAFSELNCQQLLCETFRFNQPVLDMHKRFGFIEIATELRLKGDHKEEVVITELTNNSNSYTRFMSRCLLLGSANLDFIKSSLKQCASNYSIELQLTDIPFGQHQILINDRQSSLYSIKHDFVIFLERIEDLLTVNEVLSVTILDDLFVRWLDYLDYIKQCRNNLSGTFFIANPASVSHWISGFDPNNDENKKIISTLEKMFQKLQLLCQKISDVYILDLNGLIHEVGAKHSHPEKYWYLARAPFSSVLNDRLSEKIISMMMAIRAQNARVIVLDLDNTLWSGVLGEEGLNGVVVDGDYPGNVYQSIQKIMLSFKRRGFLLALCSKNNEKTALEMFKKHPSMILSLNDIAAWRINWQSKSDNLIELSDELGLALSSFCFIDDNPLEREEVRSKLPEIFVPELPIEVSEWPEFIKKLPELANISINVEDRQRTEQYKIRKEVNNKKITEQSRIKFLKKLEIKVSCELYNKFNQQRIIQLINKTNQFNATTRRYNQKALDLFVETGKCYGIRMDDRLGSTEIIGVLMFSILNNEKKILKIDNFLLSCRVLGRDIEIAVFAWLCRFSIEKKINKMIAEIIPTEKNIPIQPFYKKLGFKQTHDNLFELDMAEKKIDMPYWIELKP
jgi:UDP-4-amino-4,6-dideoxy-N-acetyl-beta-L-altrosamine N-acetyltransferase